MAAISRVPEGLPLVFSARAANAADAGATAARRVAPVQPVSSASPAGPRGAQGAFADIAESEARRSHSAPTPQITRAAPVARHFGADPAQADPAARMRQALSDLSGPRQPDGDTPVDRRI